MSGDRRAEAKRKLEARLGHRFADPSLLERALTHASVGSGARKIADNERLEFLGDRILGLVIAEALFTRDPEASVGELSKRLHGLVSGDSCAQVARDLGVGAALRLPAGESRRGARAQDAILADACEALIAALYLDGGVESARRTVLELWSGLLDAPHDPAEASPKSELQEWLAARGAAAPSYRVVTRSGPDHSPRFTVQVAADGLSETAEASSVRAAEKAGALALLRALRARE